MFALALLLCVPSIYAQSDVKSINVTFTTIDVPGAGFTNVAGINGAGDMVGYYGSDSNASKHGFLHSGGTFTYFDYPGADSTFAQGINDSGLIAGSAEFQGGLSSTGFLYDGTTFTPIHSSNPLTFFWSINNAGEVVGSAGVSGGNFRGFTYQNGRFQVLKFPDSTRSPIPRASTISGRLLGTPSMGVTP